MAEKLTSITDIVSEAVSPVIRTINDLNISLLGTSTTVLRIKMESADAFGGQIYDVFGDVDITLDTANSSTLKDVQCFIKYPGGNIELFGTKNEETLEVDTKAIDITDILPIEMLLRFLGEYTEEPVSLQRGDLIIDYKKDGYGNIIPLILQITRILGSFLGKNIVTMGAELSFYHGQIETDIQQKIDEYMEKISNVV